MSYVWVYSSLVCVNHSISLLFLRKMAMFLTHSCFFLVKNTLHSSVVSWMMDIFDELTITTTNLRYISLRMSLSCMSMLRNCIKLASYFVDCICVWLIFYCWHWEIRFNAANTCLWYVYRLMSTFIIRSKVIEYILFEKNLKNVTKKIDGPWWMLKWCIF